LQIARQIAEAHSSQQKEDGLGRSRWVADRFSTIRALSEDELFPTHVLTCLVAE
jgi:hypothetical protein